VIAFSLNTQRRKMGFCFSARFQHDDGFEDEVGRADLVERKVGAQAFESSFPAGRLGLVFAAIASLVFSVGGAGRRFSGFRRGRTRAVRLFYFAMKQRANQALV
jgi:hypothetical protein